MPERLLVDIGNSRAHVYHPTTSSIEHLDMDEALQQYANNDVYYISVNSRFDEKLSSLPKWHNVSSDIHIDGEYNSMGVDRRALCLSRSDGIYIDAGSAITVDRVLDGKYDGGFIMLGIKASLEAYGEISAALSVDLLSDIDQKQLAFDTQYSVSYGIITPIISAIKQASMSLPLYFTGGDGEWLSGYFKDSIFDESLLFKGMSKAIASTKGQR